MRGPFFHGAGGVVSADIAVPEHAREVGFYSTVLTTGPSPLWREDLANSDGAPVIGLGERIPEYEALPLQWMPHFQVSDVGASAAVAVELGGAEVMHGRDEGGRSLWAGLTDPGGAGIGLIPVVDGAQGAGDSGRTGHIAWLSLAAPDVASACAYYERVIGWSAAPPDAEGACAMRTADGVVAAEIHPLGGAWAGIPPVWLIHLPVGDLAESLRAVRGGGGEVVWEGAGCAVIRDPVGVHVALRGQR